MIKKALIPAAGRGARLDRPYTPKPLIDIGGCPILFRLLRQLGKVGVEEAFVVVGYEGEKVAGALRAEAYLGLKVHVVPCAVWARGQAYSILSARSFFHDRESFFLAMADHVFDDCFVETMAKEEINSGVVGMVDPYLERIRDLGEAVKVDGKGGIVSAIGKGLEEFDGVDTGLFLSTSNLFSCLQRVISQKIQQPELTDALVEMARERLLTRVFVPRDSSWADVDTPSDVVYAEMWLRQKRRRGRGHEDSFGKMTVRGPLGHTLSTEQTFVTGAPHSTRVVVGRGFVTRMEELQIIPESSRSSPIFVFTDETVNGLYGEKFVAGLERYGYDVHSMVLADGEESKTLANYLYLVERVLHRGVDEQSVMVSLGGGVVCNVCGFIASTIYRGLRLVHVPTTLMAQCDAAISHKQAMNSPRGKNLVGSYFPPDLVAVDIETLETLSDELIADGLAEALKHALSQDRSYYDFLIGYQGSQRDLDFLEEVVRRNVDLKSELMAVDPKENREGMVLQYGHTVGHPVEHLSGYKLYHGQAVAVGMLVAAEVSRLMGACREPLVEIHRELLSRYGLPTKVPDDIRVPDIIEALQYNKKYLVEGTRMALLADVGRLWCVDGECAIPVSDHVVAQACAVCKEKIETKEVSKWNGSWPWSQERVAG